MNCKHCETEIDETRSLTNPCCDSYELDETRKALAKEKKAHEKVIKKLNTVKELWEKHQELLELF